MAKGSQLSQLKSALNNAGIIGKPQPSKKRKRSGGSAETGKDKEKKAARLNEIQQKLNPFDVKVTKLKHDVAGRKLKGVSGKPAQSKMAGMEQRRKTLLKEYSEKGRAGGVLDHRFGENDPTMSLEERMLERFTKERQRASKGAAFNLDDEDELTHYGQSLSKLDDFDNTDLGLDDDEEDTGAMDDELVRKTHFGGFDDDEQDEDEDEDEPTRKKSKAEVMAEVIAKSKEHKILRQMEREQGENVRHELDQAFESLRNLIYAPVARPEPVPTPASAPTTPGFSTTGSNAVPIGVTKSDVNPEETIAALGKGDVDYDQHVRELAFDKRAKPKDRTKTEAEIALEEKEKLEKAERRRRKRMLGLPDSDSEDEDAGRGQKRKRERGADDLDDDFELDGDEEEDWAGIGAGLQESNPDEHESEEDSDEEGSKEDDDEEYDEEGSDEDEEPGGEAGEHEELVSGSKSEKKPSKKASHELPYTFPCPSSHEEFLEIVDGVKDDDVPIVVQRIRALYHTSLSPDNKFKLQGLTSVLIEHMLYLASFPTPRLTVLSSLLPHLFALTQAYPISSAEFFVEKLALMHKNLKHGLSRGALDPSAKTFPGPAELSLLRIIGVLWSSSDMHHVVVSPARILMGAYLGLGRVRSLTDLASGIFVCTLWLQYEGESKRYVPEAVNFLVNALLHLAPHEYADVQALPGSFPSPDFDSELCRPLKVSSRKGEVGKPDLFAILSSTDTADEQSKRDLLHLSLNLLGKFADMYKGLPAFIELYEPISEILQNVNGKRLPEAIQTRLKSLEDTITRLLKFSRQSRKPLLLQAHKPIPIATYIPKFDNTSSSYLRKRDPDHERNEAAKLKNQYKKEKKGAIRELRKDARFLAGVQQKEQREKDKAYGERMRKVAGSIESERAEQKMMEKEKVREKKRAGRK